MAVERHAADSREKYNAYFDLMELKITEKGILPEHTYNMDKKGFMIGQIGRSKRIFSKTEWKQKKSSRLSWTAIANDNAYSVRWGFWKSPPTCPHILRRLEERPRTLHHGVGHGTVQTGPWWGGDRV
jgi:hypothetical protein